MVLYHKQLTGVLTLLSVGFTQPGAAAVNNTYAEADQPYEVDIANENIALEDEALSEIRGGFSTADGLQVAFGIERAVFVNGNLVTTSNFNINLSDLSKLTKSLTPNSTLNTNPAANAGVDSASPNTAITPNPEVALSIPQSNGMAIIQNGTGNTFQPGAILPSTLGTVIQNTLDNQKLQNVTFIQATVNSLNLLKSINMQNSVQEAIHNSLIR